MREANAVDKYLRINPQTKLFEPVWLYRDILPFWMGADPTYNNGNISLAGSGTTIMVPFKLQHTSVGMDDALGNPLLIDQLVFNENQQTTAASDFTIMLQDMGDQRQFMNAPVHIRTFAGTSQLAARLAENLFLPTRHQLMGTFTSVVTSSTQQFNLFFIGRKFDTWSSNLQNHQQDRAEMVKEISRLLERRKYVFPYWLVPDPTGFEGGSSYQAAITVQGSQTVDVDTNVGSEGHFEATHIMRAFDSGDATAAPFSVELINPQTRQSLMNGAMHSYMIGDAFNPQPLPAPFLIPAGEVLRFRITNLSATVRNLYITLRGRKIRAAFRDINEVKREYGIADVKPIHRMKGMREEMAGANK